MTTTYQPVTSSLLTDNKTQFVHLHNHSDASLLDGLSRIQDIVDRAIELGHKAIAVTDHGNLFNSWEFYKTAKDKGIKPIIGVEAYICENIHEQNRKQNHITLLAKTATGVRTLNKLMTIANTKGFYYYPRIDPNILFDNKEDIIVLSGCLGGLISQAVLRGDMEKAFELAKRFREEFGDDFYIEIQDSGLPEQQITKAGLREIARELGIAPVASNDAHYTRIEDAYPHELILTAGQRKVLADPIRGYDEFEDEELKKRGRWRFEQEEYYIKGRHELVGIYTDEELDNTNEIAEKVNIEFSEKKSHFPQFKTPTGDDAYSYLVSVLKENWRQMGITAYPNVEEYQTRIRHELSDIKSGNLASYFLIVWDVCKFADDNGIRRGDGRGSAVGSLVSYILNIHRCDPIDNGLIWERFYNAARKGSMPDIDLDIETERREEVIEYVRERYGHNKVFQFITYDTFKLKNAIKDIGRVLGYTLEQTQMMSDAVPFKYRDFEHALEQSEELRKYAKEHPTLFNNVRRIEDVKKAKSSHASAVLICDEDVLETGCIPLSYDAKNKKLVTGLDMYTLEDLGYLKLDILGLKTVSVLSEVERLINGNHTSTSDA